VGPPAPCGGQQAAELLDIFAHEVERLLGRGQLLVVGALPQLRAGKIDQHGLDTRAVEPDADGVRAARVEREQGRRLAALTVMPAAEGADEAAGFELADNLADRGMGQRRVARQIGPRRLAKPAQALQDNALVVMPDEDRRSPLTGGADGHEQTFPERPLRRPRLFN
jgi:hypothetical protein